MGRHPVGDPAVDGPNQFLVRAAGGAEDFHAAFCLGEGEEHLASLDTAGVALGTIQGLNAKLEAENAALRKCLASLSAPVPGQRPISPPCASNWPKYARCPRLMWPTLGAEPSTGPGSAGLRRQQRPRARLQGPP